MGLANRFKDAYFLYTLEIVPIYMLTSTETAILNIIITILFSLLVFALTVYMPKHAEGVIRRAYYYYSGGDMFEELSATADSVTKLLAETIKVKGSTL